MHVITLAVNVTCTCASPQTLFSALQTWLGLTSLSVSFKNSSVSIVASICISPGTKATELVSCLNSPCVSHL